MTNLTETKIKKVEPKSQGSKKRSRFPGPAFILVLLLVLALTLVVEFVGRAAAEAEVATRVESIKGIKFEDTQVTFDYSKPFIWQTIKGTYDEIHIEAPLARAGYKGIGIEMRDINIVVHDYGVRDKTMGSVDVETVVMPQYILTQIAENLSVVRSRVNNDKLEISAAYGSKPISFDLGFDLNKDALGRATSANVDISNITMVSDSSLLTEIFSYVEDAIPSIKIPIPPIPYGLYLTDATLGAGGIKVTLEGEHVNLSQ